MAGYDAALLERIDAQQRTAQAANAAAVALLVMNHWRQDVDPRNIAQSGVAWLNHAVAAIINGREKSEQLAQVYYRQVRAVAAGDSSTFEFPASPVPNLQQIRRSLTYTGLVSAAQDLATLPRNPDLDTAMRNLSPSEVVTDADLARAYERLRVAEQRAAQREQDAANAAMAKAGGATIRHVQNGGRETIDGAVAKDKVALGFVRVTRPGACWFCAMLASRGAVYRGQSFDRSDPRFTGPGEHKVHDSCACVLRPIFSRDEAELPQAARDAKALWAATGGAKEFREAYEAQLAA